MTILTSFNPSTNAPLWEGAIADIDAVNDAVNKAKTAFTDWRMTSLDERISLLNRYSDILKENKDTITDAIANETGKPRWEAATEAGALIGKIAISLEAYNARTGDSSAHMDGGITRSVHHRPIGVMAVFGPYNFPMHLPNGHIVPALLAGNTIVFKPSEETPMCGALLIKLMHQAGFPDGVINIIHGARDTGISLANHPEINGILFTGSYATGQKIHTGLAGRPEVMLALEMGGNNPLIVHEVDNIEYAAKMMLDSAYITAGQRCTCARRLIVPQGADGNKLIDALSDLIDRLIIDQPFADPAPYMGCVINNVQADHTLQGQELLRSNGARVIRETKRLTDDLPFLSAGLLDITTVSDVADEEIFGPLLQIIRVRDIEEAVQQANKTSYGLSSGLLSDNKANHDYAYPRLHAGIININRPLTGAAGTAPFGGPGRSGNYRPSAYYAADYCAYPVATLASEHVVKSGMVGIR